MRRQQSSTRLDTAQTMAFSAKKYSPKQLEIAKREKSVLFMWEMDKRFVEDPLDRCKIQCCGQMTRDKARRIWEIIQERL